MVPIEKDLIHEKLLNTEEKKWINLYHKKVYENIKSFMVKDEIRYLKKACSII